MGCTYIIILCPGLIKLGKIKSLNCLQGQESSRSLQQKDPFKNEKKTRENEQLKYSKICVKRPLKYRQNKALNDKR